MPTPETTPTAETVLREQLALLREDLRNEFLTDLLRVSYGAQEPRRLVVALRTSLHQELQLTKPDWQLVKNLHAAWLTAGAWAQAVSCLRGVEEWLTVEALTRAQEGARGRHECLRPRSFSAALQCWPWCPTQSPPLPVGRASSDAASQAPGVGRCRAGVDDSRHAWCSRGLKYSWEFPRGGG